MTSRPRKNVSCDACKLICDVLDSEGPYSIRTCSGCGRRMKVPELGKHGIGIDIRKGDEFVVPAGFIQISANPLKSSSHLYRPGLAWFIELVFGTDITGNRDNFPPYLDKQIE